MSYKCVRCGRTMPKVEGRIDMTFEIKETGEQVDMSYYLCHSGGREVVPVCKQTSHSWSMAHLASFSCYEWVTCYNELFFHGVNRKGVKKLTCRVSGTSMI